MRRLQAKVDELHWSGRDLAGEDVPGLDLDGVPHAGTTTSDPARSPATSAARLIAGGKSNLTYEVTDGTSWWIVRRPPLGHVQATAHDMGREYTAMTALADTDVPVPAHVRPLRRRRACSARRST